MAWQRQHSILIVLPWPSAALSPNARSHWRRVAAHKKKARADGANATLAAFNGTAREVRDSLAGDFGIAVNVAFFPPDNRRRDADNAVASMKAYLDGIADALRVDDRRFVPSFRFADVEKPGRVEVSL